MTGASNESGVRIEVQELSKRFDIGGNREGGVQALDQIDVDIHPSEFVAIVGASGCGKSTLLRLIAGLLTPTQGQVRINGARVEKPFTKLGIVFQRDVLLDWRTALDNVLLQAEMRGIHPDSLRDEAVSLLDEVGLEGFRDSFPSQLSGGMRQRVSICRAFLMNFPLLLMDEPFGALDALTRDQLAVDLGRLLVHRPTVLFVTHSIDEAVFLSDRVLVMTQRPGRIEAEIEVDLPRPRSLKMRDDPAFDKYTSHIRTLFVSQGVLRDSGNNEAESNGG